MEVRALVTLGEKLTGRGKGRLLDMEMFYILVLEMVT